MDKIAVVRINENFTCLEAQLNQMELYVNCLLMATLGLNAKGILNELTT